MVFVEEYIKSKAIYFIKCCFIALQINCNFISYPLSMTIRRSIRTTGLAVDFHIFVVRFTCSLKLEKQRGKDSINPSRPDPGLREKIT